MKSVLKPLSTSIYTFEDLIKGGYLYVDKTRHHVIFRLLGVDINCEVHTNIGREDAVIRTDRFIYVMEFKLRGTAEDAMTQMRDRAYALPYRNDPRKLMQIGIEFSPESRNLSRWIIA
jgi:hypothetical protein